MKQQNNTSSSTERWVQAQFIKVDGVIEVYPGYMVSDQGRIGSWVCPTRKGTCKRKTLKTLKSCPCDKLGHMHVCLKVNGKQYMRTVHRLVLSSFHLEMWSKDTNEVDHIDKNPVNNHLDNLRWIDSNGNNTNRTKCPLKKIRVTYLDDGHVEEFDNMMDCSRAFGKNLNWCNYIIREQNGVHASLNILIEKI